MTNWSGALLSVLLESSVRTAILALAVAGILASMRARSSSLKHTVWTAVLCVMLLMPVLPSLLPSIWIPVHAPLRTLTPMADEIAIAPALPADSVISTEIQPTPQTAAPVVARPIIWPYVIAGAYAAGVLLLLLRLAIGWLAMRRIEASARLRWRLIHESDIVATPMTIGIFRPMIVLPAGSRSWPRAKVRAILAHEIAHVRRRDTLTGFLAHLNCCLFWFHPMSWWLKRQLAATAEHACDDAAIRATGQARRYAEILLDIAESVRRHQGLLTWQGVGVDGNGLLEQRIDRILRGQRFPSLSFAKKIILALSCAAAIVTVVACRQENRPSIAEEQQAQARVLNAANERKVELESYTARRDEYVKRSTEANALKPDTVALIEAAVEKSPSDLDARLKLILYYAFRNNVRQFASAFGSTSVKGWQPLSPVPGGRDHVLWLIANHPKHPLAGSSLLRGIAETDSESYAEGRKLWLAQTEKSDANAIILSHAAYFFELRDKPLAEKMLQRAQAMDSSPQWSSQLARVYLLTLLGVTQASDMTLPFFEEQTLNLSISAVSSDEAHNAFAQSVRHTIENSNNELLLTDVGRYLVRPIRAVIAPQLHFASDPSEYGELGRKYLRRAIEVNKHSDAGIYLARVRSADRQARLRELPKDGRYEAVSALPESERFELLWELAKNSFEYGNSFDRLHRDEARKEWEKARRYSEDLVRLAPKFRTHPEYGTAILNGNVMLGFVATIDGDQAAAVKFLREAARAPANNDPMYRPNGPWALLCSAVLNYGERGAVIEFLERAAQIDPPQHDEFLAAAAELRAGQMPKWYRATRL